MDDKGIDVTVMDGAEGESLYINFRRVAGPKARGGKILYEFRISRDELKELLVLEEKQ